MSFSSFLKPLFSHSSRALHIVRSGSAGMARTAQAIVRSGLNVVLVAEDLQKLKEYSSLLALFSYQHEEKGTGTQLEKSIITLPSYAPGVSQNHLLAERMAAYYSLGLKHDRQSVLLTVDNFLLKHPPVSLFESHELRVYKGMDMSPELILEQAIDWGYVRSAMVNTPGEIAVRGDILDIFCPGYEKPVRLEFFGDTLDDIRLFDPLNQRSISDVEELYILPVQQIVTSAMLKQECELFWKKKVEEGILKKTDISTLTRFLEKNSNELLPGIYYEKASTIDAWLPKDSIFLIPGEKVLDIALERAERSWHSHLEEKYESEELYFPRSLALQPLPEVKNFFSAQRCVFFEDLRVGLEDSQSEVISLPEKSFDTFQSIFPQPEAQERPWQTLIATIKKWSNHDGDKSPLLHGAGLDSWFGNDSFVDTSKAKLLLSFSTERSRTRFLTLAEQDGITPHLAYDEEKSGVFALISPFRSGVAFGFDYSLILGEDVIQPRIEQAKRLPKSSFQGLDRYDTLQEGDLLVHRDYGIGIFHGLKRMNLGSVESDYLLLHYAGADKLYIPVDRLSLVQRFKGADGDLPPLDRLGGGLWAASKEKARKAIEKIAADLVEMYALRKVVKGFRYSPINEMYREFEASFGFEETPDQAKAIEDVLSDMEKPEPMDRLICGDVGFGKTEVALRAAFRAALEGRQVALLCPTTILAEQHYHTFRSRLSGFPINVGLLSRFVSKANQKQVIEGIAKGQIDIVIGTHRLLSKDIEFPNLGLLVLDEEQRFGVRHKERLKEMRKNVDALTLTATPIPRTLQLSLSGIRELSVIETPPPERKPVSTALIERDDATLRTVLERELERKGQVFWVYNRINGLESVVEYVKKLVPNARVGMAHGQMNESTLEKAVHGFWHGELDVLVSTSIVESGLDFPRANTLIVDQAHMFGLGQLYQLRGRVGRSDRQAFAVFIAPELDKLQEHARQRLRIILEMDFLGAGFQVAMEDLRLRGAGNILGESQSGHMNRLGLDLFLEMLEEAVAKLKGQPLLKNVETELSLSVPALIPEEYISDSKDRLRYYKMLSSAQNSDVQRDIEQEIRDRFGPIPEALDSFSAIISFKRKLTVWGVSKADILPDKLRLTFSENTSIDPASLIAFITEKREEGRNIRLVPPSILEIPMGDGTVRNSLELIERLLLPIAPSGI